MRASHSRQFSLLLSGLTLAATFLATDARAGRTTADYRYFRALSIDLSGRIPTRDEIAAFEKDGFDLDGWIDQRLAGAAYSAYSDRLRRVYMDLMRLDVGPAFQFVQNATVMRRQTVTGPDGKPVYVYFRTGQRRKRVETDGTFCLTQAETGLQFPVNAPATGTAVPVPQQALDQYTQMVKPWWLYRDYRSANPANRFDAAAWAQAVPGFVPVNDLLLDADGATATQAVRVCKEEAQTADAGTIYTSGYKKPPQGTPPPFGRIDFPPTDNAYAIANAGKPIACHLQSALSMSADCGCGVGLERCMPGAGPKFDNLAFVFPTRFPLGQDAATDQVSQPQSAWARLWWSEEASQLFDYIFKNDRDFREVLSGKYTFVNGPLAQFYKDVAPANCCGQGLAFGYAQPDPLLDASKLPADLLPHDTTVWKMVADRGPHASGLLTMPVFLTKYGTRRARAHVLWNTFACKDFIAGNIQLMPSTEPDLTKRQGCNICHATLEPLAAYFTRIQESSWTYLPPGNFPADDAKCGASDPSKMSTACTTFYDPAFTTATSSKLRGSYASPMNADAGPQAMAQYLTSTSQFETCVAQNVAASFLGRTLTPDDELLQQELAQTFAAGGFKMRALVKALVKSDAYKAANNLSSATIRNGGGK